MINILIEVFIRLLSKLAHDREVEGAYGTQNRNVFDIHEDSSTGATQQLPAGVEFQKKSISTAILFLLKKNKYFKVFVFISLIFFNITLNSMISDIINNPTYFKNSLIIFQFLIFSVSLELLNKNNYTKLIVAQIFLTVLIFSYKPIFSLWNENPKMFFLSHEVITLILSMLIWTKGDEETKDASVRFFIFNLTADTIILIAMILIQDFAEHKILIENLINYSLIIKLISICTLNILLNFIRTLLNYLGKNKAIKMIFLNMHSFSTKMTLALKDSRQADSSYSGEAVNYDKYFSSSLALLSWVICLLIIIFMILRI